MSENGLVIAALIAKVARVKNDSDFMEKLGALTERDRFDVAVRDGAPTHPSGTSSS